LLDLRDVSTAYGGVPVNRDVSFNVAAGQVVSLIGRNGVGKTTLAKAVIGLQPARTGAIIFDGIDVTRRDARERARLGIGYVPQGRGIFADMTVQENLHMGRRIGAQRAPIERVYDLFPILRERRGQLGGTLSGGQQQMLSIGRVLMGRPKLLALDEPSDGIQPNIVELIGAIIRRLNREDSLTILLIEQNVDLITLCADRCLLMEKGTIVQEIAPETLNDPDVARRALAI
jgi:branched-chain amino acid transport system ATP-binding protein